MANIYQFRVDKDPWRKIPFIVVAGNKWEAHKMLMDDDPVWSSPGVVVDWEHAVQDSCHIQPKKGICWS